MTPSVIKAFTPEGMARAHTVLATTHFAGERLVRAILTHYLSYFDPVMLFVRGGPHLVQSVPGLGLWNLVDLPMMVVGFVALVRGHFDRRLAGFLVFWLLLGPLPGGLAAEAQNVGRAIGWLPAPQMLSGLGFAVIGARISGLVRSGSRARIAGGILAACLVALAYGATAHQVYRRTLVRYPEIAQHAWQFEISEALRCARTHRVDEKVLISPGFHMARVFSSYHFIGFENPVGTGRVWRLSDPARLTPGQLYAFPAHRPAPAKGREICRVEDPRTGRVLAFVFGSEDASEARAD